MKSAERTKYLAAARPEGPAPMTAIFLALIVGGDESEPILLFHCLLIKRLSLAR